jgi:hypothetical protein
MSVQHTHKRQSKQREIFCGLLRKLKKDRERRKIDTGESSSPSQAPDKERQLRVKPARDVDDFNATAIRQMCKTFTGRLVECHPSVVSNYE